MLSLQPLPAPQLAAAVDSHNLEGTQRVAARQPVGSLPRVRAGPRPRATAGGYSSRS
jgi:hypothetical protein